MSDFDDLRQIREAKVKAEVLARQKQLEEENRKTEGAQRLEDRKRANADILNDTVVEVLELLMDALHPDLKLQRLGLDSWGIVRVGPNEYGGYEIELVAVVVELEFNRNGEPQHFLSHKDRYRYRSKTVRSSLTRDDLVRSLKKLHPPQSLV